MIVDKEELQTFIHLLKTPKITKKVFDLGLIIKEPGCKIDASEIFNELKKLVDIEKIVYDQQAIDENIFEEIINSFQKGKWVFIEIKKDLSSPLLNQLKHLADYNTLQLIDYRDQDIFEMKMPESSRIIIFTERDFIENKISYPHFYRLFGPVLSLK